MEDELEKLKKRQEDLRIKRREIDFELETLEFDIKNIIKELSNKGMWYCKDDEKWHKNCPSCNTIMDYLTYSGCLSSKKKSTCCEICRKVEKFIRNCPSCMDEIIYYGVMAFKRSSNKNTKCKKCSTSENAKRAYEKNKEKAFHKRRVVEKRSGVTGEFIMNLLINTDKCGLCNKQMNVIQYHSDCKHIDHIVPLCVGGEHSKENIRVICQKCNLTRPKDGSDI